MNKKLIRLTESDLHRIVKESVNKLLKEGYYDFDDDFNADDIECPSCGSNNVEPIYAIDTHYRCLDCGEEFYLDGGWEPDWGAMRHESHKRNGKSINEAGRQSYTQKKYNYKTRHSIITDAQNEVTRLRGEITALTQQIRRTQDPQAREELIAQRQELCKLRNRAVAKVWNLSNERTMTDGAKQRAAIKRKADYARTKNRITFKPQDDPYYVSESYNQFSDLDFGSNGDPYGFFDDEELEDNLNGYYGSFNHIWVKIMNDGKPNAYIMVGSNMDNQKQAFEGEEAQRILDKIRYDAENTYGKVQTAIYHNLYKYVV